MWSYDCRPILMLWRMWCQVKYRSYSVWSDYSDSVTVTTADAADKNGIVSILVARCRANINIFIYLFIYLSIYLFTYSLTHSFIHSFIQSFIHSFLKLALSISYESAHKINESKKLQICTTFRVSSKINRWIILAKRCSKVQNFLRRNLNHGLYGSTSSVSNLPVTLPMLPLPVIYR